MKDTSDQLPNSRSSSQPPQPSSDSSRQLATPSPAVTVTVSASGQPPLAAAPLRPTKRLQQPSRAPRLEPAAEKAPLDSSVAPANSPFSNKTFSELVCLELCAGSANLSHALRNRGFDAIAIDSSHNKHQSKLQCLQLDLSGPQARDVIIHALAISPIAYVHVAPPCGTASRARERPLPRHLALAGVPQPKPLRDSSHPSGLPNLQGVNLDRVTQANAIYQLCAELFALCHARGIPCTIENPRSSWLWEIDPFPYLVKNHTIADFQNCMYGGARDKWSRFLCSHAAFERLRIACDNSHNHLPWGASRGPSGEWVFATASEAEYTPGLCEAISSIVCTLALQRGALAPAQELLSTGLSLTQRRKKTRATAGKLPRGRALPPLVSEYAEVITIPTSELPLADAHKVVRQFLEGGAGGSVRELSVVGLYRSPEAFYEHSKTLLHPRDSPSSVADVTKIACFNLLTMGPELILRRRCFCLKDLAKRAEALEVEESAIHQAMDPGTRQVLRGKRLLLLESILVDIGHPDSSLVREVIEGFPLTGSAPLSHIFPMQLRLATKTPQALRKQGAWSRPIISARAVSCGDAVVDQRVWDQTLAEVSEGWLEGPVSIEDLNCRFHGEWISSRRFGLRQGPDKIRLIDNGRESELNCALTTHEKLELQDVDDLVCLLDGLMTCVSAEGGVKLSLSTGEVLEGIFHGKWGPAADLKWSGRTLDLRAAYKQVATSSAGRWAATIVVFNPVKGCAEHFVSNSLMFGSTAAVYAFNRISKALWHAATVCLDIIGTCYYDDFPCIEPLLTATAARKSFEGMLDILGWAYADSPGKAEPYRGTFTALGVELVVQDLFKGSFCVQNKPTRVNALLVSLQEALDNNQLSPPSAASLHGKLQFAEAQVFGRAAKPFLHTLSARAHASSSEGHGLTKDLKEALESLRLILTSAKPRQISRSDLRAPVLIFTDGASEGDVHSFGALVHDCSCGWTITFEGHVSKRLVESWRASIGGMQVIGQVELLPLLLIRIGWPDRLHNRRTICFVDNDSARDGLIKAYSPSRPSMRIISAFYQAERLHPCWLWVARVPSKSNPADEPSRLEASQAAARYGAVQVEAPSLSTAMENFLCS